MFRSLIGKVYFSEQGTADAAKERATYMMFFDLLYNIEGEYWYLFKVGCDVVFTPIHRWL